MQKALAWRGGGSRDAESEARSRKQLTFARHRPSTWALRPIPRHLGVVTPGKRQFRAEIPGAAAVADLLIVNQRQEALNCPCP